MSALLRSSSPRLGPISSSRSLVTSLATVPSACSISKAWSFVSLLLRTVTFSDSPSPEDDCTMAVG